MMISPYVQMAARRARILGAGSEPDKADPGFDVVSNQIDPTVPDDAVCVEDGDHHRDHLVWFALIFVAGIAFMLGWLAVSGLGGN